MKDAKQIESYQLGMAAFERGAKRAPALDGNLAELMKGTQVGDGAYLMREWLRGWEAGQQRHEVATETYTDAQGVIRWRSNDQVPPVEVLAACDMDLATLARCNDARVRDTRAFLAQYRESRKDYQYSHEEMAEMRAAFGPGATVVNVITGKRTRL